jgi:uncharacterized protein
MKIGVLSDTHGDISNVERAVRILKNVSVGMIIHCGDVGVEVVAMLKGVHTHFVPGNMDDPEELRTAITEPEHTLHTPIGELEIEGRKTAFLHGHDVRLLRHTIQSGHWDLVCHGHTHAFSKGRDGPTLVLNPGALSRTSHPSLAVVEFPSLEVTEISL